MFLYPRKWQKNSYSKASIRTKASLSQFTKEISKGEMMEKGGMMAKEEAGEEAEEEGGEAEIEGIEVIEETEGIEEMVKGLKGEIEGREETDMDQGEKDRKRST
jgi:hypothetical protein